MEGEDNAKDELEQKAFGDRAVYMRFADNGTRELRWRQQ
jgi:hypothetical protein